MYMYIYGAGRNGKKWFELLSMWCTQVTILAFIDRKADVIMSYKGTPVIDLQTAIEQGGQNEFVLVSPVDNKGILEMLEQLNFSKVICGAHISNNFYYYIPNKLFPDDYKEARPFNWYESPYADLRVIHRQEKEIFSYEKEIKDINFNVDYQIELIKDLSKLCLPEWQDERCSQYRYFYNNSMFGKGSADALAFMMQHLRPNKIIEVGSGYSTAVMLDTNDRFFNGKIEIHSIEPFSDRLKALLRKNDRIKLTESFLEDIPLDIFDELNEQDILFIDSSHVSKIHSDVNYIFFEILPRLKKGVYIHFHDMFYPFEYPSTWIYKGKTYNEMYLLRTF